MNMVKKEKVRIILAKFGLDGHDNGIKTIAKWLGDAGFEVIYMGLYNTAEGTIKAAQEEDVKLIGASFLEGEHMFYVPRLLELAREEEMKDVKFAVGGVIPPDDVKALKEMGVHRVYTAGTPRNVIIDGIKALA
jgi:methylmalonyl-CoA mutase C-terminal domain/subunit